MDIRVAGQEIDVNINGEPVVEYIQPTAPYRTDANAYALLSEGTFAIESDGSGEIQIKNITVNVIDESTISTHNWRKLTMSKMTRSLNYINRISRY